MKQGAKGQRTHFLLVTKRLLTIFYLNCMMVFSKVALWCSFHVGFDIEGPVSSSLASCFPKLTVFNTLQPLMFENIVMETLHMLREMAISGDTEKRKVKRIYQSKLHFTSWNYFLLMDQLNYNLLIDHDWWKTVLYSFGLNLKTLWSF